MMMMLLMLLLLLVMMMTLCISLQILSGAVVASGELEAVVTATGTDTFFGKTLALLGQPEERGHLQTVKQGWDGVG